MRTAKKILTRSTMLTSVALVCSMPIMPASAQSSVRPVLTAEQCVPLTEQNYAICCVALNRDELLTRSELDQCPPITTGQVGTDDAGTDDSGTDDGGTDDGSSDDAAGNPGNEKSVGAAGEGPGPHSTSDFGPTGSFGKGDANGNAGGQGRRGDAPGHN